jgi:hypothetical protein
VLPTGAAAAVEGDFDFVVAEHGDIVAWRVAFAKGTKKDPRDERNIFPMRRDAWNCARYVGLLELRAFAGR